MKTTLSIIFAVSAAPAFSHPAAQFHSHAQTGGPVLAGLVAIGVAVLIARRLSCSPVSFFPPKAALL